MLKEKGTSTLGGQNIWWDDDIRRLNSDGRGRLLGEFKGDDRLVVWTSKHQYYVTGFDIAQHFPDETIRVERYVSDRVYNLCYFDREQGYYYMKRFPLEASDRLQSFLDEDGMADFVCITSAVGATLRITYKGAQATRPADEISVDDFVGVKSRKAKGKRLTTYDVDTLTFIEPELPEEPEQPEEDEPIVPPAEGAEGAADVEIDASDMIDDEEVAPISNGGASLEIIRNEIDAMADPEQLNLF